MSLDMLDRLLAVLICVVGLIGWGFGGFHAIVAVLSFFRK